MMIGKRNLFAVINLAVFAGLAAGLFARGIEGQGWTFALALLGCALNLVFVLLNLREDKTVDSRNKERLMEELRQEAEERKERRQAERN